MNYKSVAIRQGLVLIGFAGLVLWAVFNVPVVLSTVLRTLSIISPFITGLVLAFIFNGLMVRIEAFLFGPKSFLKKLPKKSHRSISLLLTILLIGFVIYLLVLIIMPELIKTTAQLISALPTYLQELQIFIEDSFNPSTQMGSWLQMANVDLGVIEANILLWVQNSWQAWLNSSLSILQDLLNTLFMFLLSFFFSLYILLDKERLGSQVKRVIKAFVSEKKSDFLFDVLKKADDIFSSFIFGQFIEALIIGSIFFVVLTIFNYPYAMLISVIISVTALIPMVGAMLGMAIGMILIATKDVGLALWFFVIFQSIQQIENNLIYPKVVGSQIGLPPMFILIAITIGGSLFGLLGILFSIPVFTLIYVLFKEWVNRRLEAQKT